MHRLDWFFGRCCVASKVPSLESVHTAPECVPGPNVGNDEDEAVDTVDVGETPNLLTKDRSGKPMLTKGLTFRNGHRYKRRVSEMPNDEDARTFYAEAIEEKIHAPGRGPIEGMQVEDLVRMLKKLKINDLDTQEVERIFEKIPKETPGRVSMLEFLTALKTGPASISLKNFISRYRQGLNFGFDVSQDYDYSKPTCENYKMDEKEFFGDYREIRQDRDYTYHVNYIQKRQIWQDRAIASIVHRTGLQADPWLVYTCGPMGVGKGYAMSWMSKHGFFPLENIVHVDPDAFKLMMPEWPGYTEVDKENAGTMCHMESSFMMEIAQEAAMQRRQNIWIDGSLRNADFYSEQFKQVRSQYPFYRIAIFYVTAPEEMVRARIAERARATGRDVPEHLIQASLNSMDKSLNTLTPLCDFVVRVSNEGAIPILKACETIDTSGSWEVVTDRLARKAGGPGSFPNALQPQTLGKLAKEHMRLLRVDSTRHNMMVDLGNRDPENPIHEKLLNIMPKVGLTGSIIHITGVEITPISIPDESRQLMGIPREAETSFFLYPHQALAKSGVKRMLSETGFTELESISSLMQLLSRGGFGYCDIAGHVVSVDTFTNQEGHALLQFDKRQTVSEEALPDNLFMPTPARYREATSYAFVPPGKMFGEHCVGGAHGALVFRLKVPREPSVVSFPVMAD